MTQYVILKSDSGAELYAPIGEQEASSDQTAITRFLEAEVSGVMNGEKFGEGDYRAIPARSWGNDGPRAVRKKISFG